MRRGSKAPPFRGPISLFSTNCSERRARMLRDFPALTKCRHGSSTVTCASHQPDGQGSCRTVKGAIKPCDALRHPSGMINCVLIP
jgi:hypothetical protein